MISASFLSIKENIKENIMLLDQTNIDYIHLDIMDGNFVPNKTNNDQIIKMTKLTNHPLDAHLMVSDLNLIDEFINLKPTYLTIHVELDTDIKLIIDKIKKNGIKAGLSIKPNTKLDALKPYLNDIDLVLVMMVDPGMGGQKLLPEVITKLNELNKLQKNYNFKIEVDGGINIDNIKYLNADIYVIGSYITNSSNYKETVNRIKEVLNEKNKD